MHTIETFLENKNKLTLEISKAIKDKNDAYVEQRLKVSERKTLISEFIYSELKKEIKEFAEKNNYGLHFDYEDQANYTFQCATGPYVRKYIPNFNMKQSGWFCFFQDKEKPNLYHQYTISWRYRSYPEGSNLPKTTEKTLRKKFKFVHIKTFDMQKIKNELRRALVDNRINPGESKSFDYDYGRYVKEPNYKAAYNRAYQIISDNRLNVNSFTSSRFIYDFVKVT